jgi:hypothetical protein
MHKDNYKCFIEEKGDDEYTYSDRNLQQHFTKNWIIRLKFIKNDNYPN